MKMKNNKVSFALLILMLMVSSVMIFPFIVTILLLPGIFVSGNNPVIPTKGTFEALLLLGVAIQTYLIIFSIKRLYRMTKEEKPI